MFCDRKTYSVLVIGNSEAATVNEIQNAVRRMHPAAADSERIEIKKNKGGNVCVVHSATHRREKTPTLYAMGRASGYTGKTLFVQKCSLDICEFEKGALLESRYLENNAENISRFSRECGMVFVPSGYVGFSAWKKDARVFRYPGDSKAEFKTAMLKSAMLAACIVVAVCVMAVISRRASKKAAAVEAERQNFMANEAAEKERRLLADEVLKARSEYETKAEGVPWDSYTLMSMVSSCVGGNAKIKSVAVSGNEFSAELEGKNFSAALAEFERSHDFSNCRVSRMSGERGGNSESFTLSGMACPKRPGMPSERLDDKERLSWYEARISELEKGRVFDGSLSEAFALVRRLSAECFCETEYVQISDEGGIKMELSFSGARTQVMRLLEALCAEFDICDANLSMREGGRLGLLCRADTGIQGQDKNGWSEGLRLPPETIAALFKYKGSGSPSSRGVVAPVARADGLFPSVSGTKPRTNSVRKGRLAFLGRGESKGARVVFVKDEASGKVSKCGNFTEKPGLILVELDGDLYEVAK